MIGELIRFNKFSLTMRLAGSEGGVKRFFRAKDSLASLMPFRFGTETILKSVERNRPGEEDISKVVCDSIRLINSSSAADSLDCVNAEALPKYTLYSFPFRRQ